MFSIGFLAYCAALPFGNATAANGDLAFVSDTSDVSQAHIIDVRTVDECEHSALPHARCLPMDNFVSPTGKVIDFHALRWLLGTVGLSGAETVVVVGATTDNARTVGALLYLAGQKRVLMLDTPLQPHTDAPGGDTRSLSREAVFTAPMRDIHLLTHTQRDTTHQTSLAQFALAVGRGAENARIALGFTK